MPGIIRIVTRESRLALWQTNFIAERLAQSGHDYEINPLQSTGDVDLDRPLYEMGIEGIFTKELDIALLNQEADIAVHSMKDIPTILANGLVVAAVAERGDFEDIVFLKPSFNPEKARQATIASCSLRRKAQWLRKFPGHTMVNLRGNIDTRIKKFHDSDWDGMILAKAGVVRLGYDLKETKLLDWMIPAPAQGAIAVVCRKEDINTIRKVQPINHAPTYHCTAVERDFLRYLNGGCSAPISGHAYIADGNIHFNGAVYSIDGVLCYEIQKIFPEKEWKVAGRLAAEHVLKSDVVKAILSRIEESKHFNTYLA